MSTASAVQLAHDLLADVPSVDGRPRLDVVGHVGERLQPLGVARGDGRDRVL